MSKTTRKVTVDTNRRSSGEGLSISSDLSSKAKKKSVFERLGTAGSYEGEKRSYGREGETQYGNKYRYSQDIGLEMKKSKREDRYFESDEGGYQEVEEISESKRDKRKIQEGERLKIEFKKEPVMKKKQTIAEIYEEEVPLRRIKKEKERKEREIYSQSKSKFSAEEEMMLQKDEHVRNIQLKGDERKDRKSKSEIRDDDDSQSEATSSKKHKRKRKMEDSDDDAVDRKEKGESSKRKKKKKDKSKYESSSSDSESDRERKKKSKKEKHKSYESDNSSLEKRKSKNQDYEDVEDRRIITESKKKKKKKKDKYESESEGYSEKEEYSKRERTDKSYETEKSKKNRRAAEDYDVVERKKKSSEGKKQKHSPDSRKESQKGKEKSKRSPSYSSLSSGSSLGEDDANVVYRKKGRKEKIQEKDYRDDSKKYKERNRDKYDEPRASHVHPMDEPRDMFMDERRKDVQQDPYSRDHYPPPQHQEPRLDSWERDRTVYDDRQQPRQYASPYPYDRARGPDPYRGRYDPPPKAGDRDRMNYRQYQDQQYGTDQARYRERGNRDPYQYQHGSSSRGYPREDDVYQGGRSRDPYQGGGDPAIGYLRDDKPMRGHRGDYPPKVDPDEIDDRGRKKIPQHSSKERNEYESRSPVSRRSRSPKEDGRDDSKDRSKAKKRKRDDDVVEREQSLEKKGKRTKTDGKSDSEADSGSEADPKSDKGRKSADYERKDSRRVHRDSEGHQKRDEYTDEKRDRKSDRRGREHEKDRDRGKDRDRERERDRDRDRRHKTGSSGDRIRGNKPRSEKRGDSPANEENRSEKAEDKRVKALKSSHRQSSPSRKSDSESGSRSQRKGKGRSTPQEGLDGSLDDVYEKISDDELDFFDEDTAKSSKPAALEDIDWSALSSIGPSSKKEEVQEGESHRSKHSALSVLKSIGFSPNLLQNETIKRIQEKLVGFAKTSDGVPEDEFADLDSGIGALIASKMKNRRRRRNLITSLANQGTVLSMRKDINIRKELGAPQNRVGMTYSLFCNAPATPADKELFMASASLYEKITPGETEPSCDIVPSLVGSVIECAN